MQDQGYSPLASFVRDPIGLPVFATCTEPGANEEGRNIL